jgi:hypothetical protein
MDNTSGLGGFTRRRPRAGQVGAHLLVDDDPLPLRGGAGGAA